MVDHAALGCFTIHLALSFTMHWRMELQDVACVERIAMQSPTVVVWKS